MALESKKPYYSEVMDKVVLCKVSLEKLKVLSINGEHDKYILSLPLLLQHEHAIELIEMRSLEVTTVMAFSRLLKYHQQSNKSLEKMRSRNRDLGNWTFLKSATIYEFEKNYQLLVDAYSKLLNEPYCEETPQEEPKLITEVVLSRIIKLKNLHTVKGSSFTSRC
jgi:hypothetical protein